VAEQAYKRDQLRLVPCSPGEMVPVQGQSCLLSDGRLQFSLGHMPGGTFIAPLSVLPPAPLDEVGSVSWSNGFLWTDPGWM